MNKKVLSSGAEAVIFQEGNFIIKSRIKKSYRIKELDDKIRKSRTKSESKILSKANDVVLAPKVISVDESKKEIKMDFVHGEKLSDFLNNINLKEQKIISKKIGESVGKLHCAGIIHGDLTTSNIIYLNKEIYLIDFGLAYLNGKYEDKAVDLHLLRQALEAKHFTNWEDLFKEVKKGYLSVNNPEGKKVLDRLESVEKRGRYKKQKLKSLKNPQNK